MAVDNSYSNKISLTSASPGKALPVVPNIKAEPAVTSIEIKSISDTTPETSPSVVQRARKVSELMNRIHLSPMSQQLAERLNLLDSFLELEDLRSAPESDLSAQVKRLTIKQHMNESVLVVTLQVRDVAARIDRQVTLLNRQRQFMEDRRDKASRINSIANLLSNGFMQEIGQAGEMKVNEVPGEELELVAGGLTVMLGAIALKKQGGSREPASTKPNLLAKVFEQPTSEEVEYPPIVWWYLNTAPPGLPSTETRRAELMRRWRKFGVLAGNKPADARRGAMLSSSTKRQMLTIGLLSDQATLLSEVKSEVYQLDHEVLQLMVGLQAL